METNYYLKSREDIEEILQRGYNISPTSIISEGWEIFKKEAGSYIGFYLIYLSVSILLSLIPLVSMLAPIVTFPLMVGVYIFTSGLYYKRKPEFNQFFDGFKKIGKFAMLYLMMIGIFFVITIILVIVGIVIYKSGNFHNPFSEVAYMDRQEMLIYFVQQYWMQILIGILVILVVGIYLSASFVFLIPLIFFTNLNVWECLSYSVKLSHKSLSSIIGLLLLLYLIQILGALCLLVGLIVTSPLIFVCMSILYEKAIGSIKVEDIGGDIVDSSL